MDRRTFVQTVGAAAAGAKLAPHLGAFDSPVQPSRLKRIGLELYSVRDAMKADPEATLAKVHAMGYNDVELLFSFGNFGRTPQQVRAALDHEGLHAPSAHIAPESLLTNWQKTIDDARYIGLDYLIVPSLPAETNTSLDAWKLWAERFNNAGQLTNKAGMWLAFHNEPEHSRPIGGQVPLDLFIRNTDPSVVRLQLDVGNMLMGGGDPMAYVSKYADRYWSFHLKDVTADRKHDTELGTGTFNLRKFLSSIRDVDKKPCYVEQESPSDPMVSAGRNYTYLSNLDF